MHRANAYSALAKELDKWSGAPPEGLVALINTPPRRIPIQEGNDEFEIEIAVAWEGPNKKAVRVVGTANGSNSWRLERLQESIIVPLP